MVWESSHRRFPFSRIRRIEKLSTNEYNDNDDELVSSHRAKPYSDHCLSEEEEEEDFYNPSHEYTYPPRRNDDDSTVSSLSPYFFQRSKKQQQRRREDDDNDKEMEATTSKLKQLRRKIKNRKRKTKPNIRCETTTKTTKKQTTTIEIDPTFMLAVVNGTDVVLLEEEDYCGTSSAKNNQLFRGNTYFHELLERCAAVNNNTKSYAEFIRDEDSACEAILQAIKDRNGRFLMVNERTCCLYVLSDRDALEQIRRAYRRQNRGGKNKKRKKMLRKQQQQQQQQNDDKSKKLRGKRMLRQLSCVCGYHHSKKKRRRNEKTEVPENSFFPMEEPIGVFA